MYLVLALLVALRAALRTRADLALGRAAEDAAEHLQRGVHPARLVDGSCSVSLNPRAKGIWRDDERGAALVKDEPVVVHCYTTPADIEDDRNLAELGGFCRKMGREARQGEVGLVVGDEYFAIRDFGEE